MTAIPLEKNGNLTRISTGRLIDLFPVATLRATRPWPPSALSPFLRDQGRPVNLVEPVSVYLGEGLQRLPKGRLLGRHRLMRLMMRDELRDPPSEILSLRVLGRQT